MKPAAIYWLNSTTGQVGSTEDITEEISGVGDTRFITLTFKIPQQNRRDDLEYFTDKQKLLDAVKNLIP